MVEDGQDIHLVAYYKDGLKDVLVYRYDETNVTLGWMDGAEQWDRAWERLVELEEKTKDLQEKTEELEAQKKSGDAGPQWLGSRQVLFSS